MKLKKFSKINKKGDIHIIVMTMLVIALILFTLFQFNKNKNNVDSISLDYGALDMLYNKETNLNFQLRNILEPLIADSYERSLNPQPTILGEEITEENIEQYFKENLKIELIKKIDALLKEKNSLEFELAQIKDLLSSSPNSISLENKEILSLNLANIKSTIVSLDKENNKELFRGVYNINTVIKINLTEIGLSQLSFLFIKDVYTKCKPETEQLLCINNLLPQFTSNFEYKEGFKLSTPITQKPDYQITYLNLTTKRNFQIGKSISPVNIKILVDAKELSQTPQ